jgi:hypothetical protein
VLESSVQSVSVAFEHQGIALPTRFRKVLTLRADEATVRVDYAIANEGAVPLDVHWKVHPALPLAPGARLHLAARRVLDEPGFGEVFADREFAWPNATRADGSPLDLSRLPDPDSGSAWFAYGVDLAAGYAAISYPEEGIGFGLGFDRAVLDAVWIFGTFGGWRGLNTVILEPCTGYLANLPDAIANGSVLTLPAHGEVTTSLAATVLDGLDEITAFEQNGGRA